MKAAALFCLAFLTTAMPAAAFPAHVDRCHDGDTRTMDMEVRIRLAEIDTPEIGRPDGAAERNALCSMVCGLKIVIGSRGPAMTASSG